MIHPVYRANLAVERLDSYYYRLEESKLSERGRQDYGQIEVGPELPVGTNVYRLGVVPRNFETFQKFGIIAVYHVMLVSREAKAEQDYLSPRNRPYAEDPVDFKGLGISEGGRYSIAGVYYPSNTIQGWMNITPQA
jgi:hypothetical protein